MAKQQAYIDTKINPNVIAQKQKVKEYMSYQKYKEYLISKKIFESFDQDDDDVQDVKMSRWNKIRSQISNIVKRKEKQYESYGE
tara:strand:+ start:285 stop:536 length:252 start_codon:yes stop_codon:yes gene_type:complete